ncbi:MAG: hypothetical protein HDS11_00415 [Bacteroides sp.]|nr:hypothetical protein [Bacteroides sp.]MBD5377915.1 hypothetical protein [Bacteroides sp.]
MKKLIFTIFALSALAVAMTSCGGGHKSAEVTDEQTFQLSEAIRAHDYTTASVLADSMALYVDDLTPDQTVTVLMAFLEVHNRAVEEGRAEDDLETLRKFVDVYDIALSLNPNDMRAAFREAVSRNPELDFEKSYSDFRHALAEYDALQDYGEVEQAPAARPDTTKTTPADSVDTSAKVSLDVD